jgi:YidC/Oxa1 family membrane protein insertase
VRAELVEQSKPGRFKYRALEHDGGYLGYLALQPDPKGARIKLVPPGSPAERAKSSDTAGGLKVGDVLLTINNQSIDTPTSAELVLQKLKPGKPVEMTVLRDVDGSEQTLKFQADLIEAPLDVLRKDEFRSEYVAGNYDSSSLTTTLASLNGTRIPAGKNSIPALAGVLRANWEIKPLQVPGGEGVECRLPLDGYLENTGRPKQLDLVKRYRLLPKGTGQDGYILDLETVVVNRNEEPVEVSVRQSGLTGLTLEGWWYSVKISPDLFASAGQRDVMYSSQGLGHEIRSTRAIVDYAKKTPAMPAQLIFSESASPQERSLKYIGLDAQYFNASMLPHPEAPESLNELRQAASTLEANATALNKSQLQAANVSFWFDTSDQTIEPGKELSQRYQVFIGPKETSTLAAHGLDRAIEYGWFPWIAKPLSAFLHFFYAIVRNYGIAIIMLTVMVRGAMFPLGRKAAMNAQRMQELQPELKKINDLYKDNMEKRAKAMQELYQKHNFKPLAGCLPMLIQLPIFLGLYRCLSVDISLRQAPLFPGLDWCSNLAGPDMLINWSSWMPDFIAGRGTGWLGPYFNILPMVTVALFLVQQKILMPKATDEQTRMTQNMMQVMTVFMGVLFFKVPAGLCIYFITSSIWSLVERNLVKRLTPPGSTNATDSNAVTKPSNNGDTPPQNRKDRNRQAESPAPEKSAMKTRLDELRAMLDKPNVRSATQRDSRKERKRKK